MSSVLSIAASVTSVDTRSTSAVPMSPSLTSGYTSKVASKATWPSGAPSFSVIFGEPATRSLASLTASLNTWPTLSFMTS